MLLKTATADVPGIGTGSDILTLTGAGAFARAFHVYSRRNHLLIGALMLSRAYVRTMGFSYFRRINCLQGYSCVRLECSAGTTISNSCPTTYSFIDIVT